MSEFYVWATLMSEHAVNSLVNGLIREGLTVGPLGDGGNLTSGNNVARLVALNIKGTQPQVEGNKEVHPQNWLRGLIQEILQTKSCRYYSVIVYSKQSGYCWAGCNIELPPEKKPSSRYERMVDDDEEPLS